MSKATVGRPWQYTEVVHLNEQFLREISWHVTQDTNHGIVHFPRHPRFKLDNEGFMLVSKLKISALDGAKCEEVVKRDDQGQGASTPFLYLRISRI